MIEEIKSSIVDSFENCLDSGFEPAAIIISRKVFTELLPFLIFKEDMDLQNRSVWYFEFDGHTYEVFVNKNLEYLLSVGNIHRFWINNYNMRNDVDKYDIDYLIFLAEHYNTIHMLDITDKTRSDIMDLEKHYLALMN